ncbi:MAG: signal peptidase II [Rhodobacter sp.]|jgi:signal peptidase II|nr:signal peptidase II [Rhodobacter sp.]
MPLDWQWSLQACGISGIEAGRRHPKGKPLIRTFITALAVFLLDQLSKLAVVQWLGLKSVGRIDVLPPYLNFRMAWNQGVNFGLFSNDANVMRWVLIALALAISVWVLNWARKMSHWSGQVFAGCVIGGALGNVIDRVVYGAVADFLNMSCCGLNNPYAFNIADVAIFAGAFGLVLASNKHDNKE